MIVYNTTFHIDSAILEESVAYLKNIYIPEAVASGFLQQPCLRRIMHTPEGEGESYSVQFHVKNMDTLEYWLEKEGHGMHQKLTSRFGNKIAGFTTLLEELDI
ncbi:hypothetical protein M2459_002759 [Parabacteroides sp. PF5-5]|uniref:DUF4286 family protein n=1 Tax=unclassified Parabacteroides TaxID=2649774 RepID=UPI0024760EA6|nr:MULTISPECIES: DUF4286 family protein [unclassified Parabacteroides]MDH6306097.1 hypothetical protein [Parabacteroides sp. PH5-39]MDH6317005.1 hypothetical protein [Parabacteroides sp. PF5-13]MDH6324540.1 hypothetical protein [Parabacteroides sp. PH5-8]MDH6328190.1 hypothetical protein [Parabacteroides sp. PH5-41]MDH6335992.1 hypothetical protein [Parabacteroides sp. PF5-5]